MLDKLNIHLIQPSEVTNSKISTQKETYKNKELAKSLNKIKKEKKMHIKQLKKIDKSVYYIQRVEKYKQIYLKNLKDDFNIQYYINNFRKFQNLSIEKKQESIIKMNQILEIYKEEAHLEFAKYIYKFTKHVEYRKRYTKKTRYKKQNYEILNKEIKELEYKNIIISNTKAIDGQKENKTIIKRLMNLFFNAKET